MSKYSGGIYSKILSVTDGLEIATLEIIVLREKAVSFSWLSSLQIQEFNSFDTQLLFPIPTGHAFR